MGFRRCFTMLALAGAAAGPTWAGQWGAEFGFEGGLRLQAGGGPYGAMLCHLCPCRFARVGGGIGFYSLSSLEALGGSLRSTSYGYEGTVLFVSGEAVWPGSKAAAKLHLEFGSASVSHKYHYYPAPGHIHKDELFYSAAPGVEFKLHPHLHLTCEGGLGFHTWGLNDEWGEWGGEGFKYGIFNLGARFVF